MSPDQHHLDAANRLIDDAILRDAFAQHAAGCTCCTVGILACNVVRQQRDIWREEARHQKAQTAHWEAEAKQAAALAKDWEALANAWMEDAMRDRAIARHERDAAGLAITVAICAVLLSVVLVGLKVWG